jgi:hypothetical protein
MMVLGGRALGKWLDYEDGAFMNEISEFTKEASES